jgi:hypothetical protein
MTPDSQIRTKPTLFDRAVIWVLTKVPRVRFIIDQGIGEAFDQGFKRGLRHGASLSGSKNLKNKVTKILKKMYS